MLVFDMSEKIAVLLTAFNPDVSSLVRKVEGLSKGGLFVFLADNSDDIITQRSLNSQTDYLNDVVYIDMKGNKGIAAAQNSGLERALLDGFNYFVELDQDTSLDSDTVYKLVDSFKSVKSIDSNCFGLGPIAIDVDTNLPYHGLAPNQGIVKVEHTLSSGFTFSKDSIERVGLKENDLFIDLVDWEWCMRGNHEGLTTYVNTDIKIDHELGEGHLDLLIFRLGSPKPFRLYFQYRNLIWLLGRGYIPLKWKVKRVLISSVKILLFAILYEDRVERLKHIFSGVKDGLGGYMKFFKSRERDS